MFLAFVTTIGGFLPGLFGKKVSAKLAKLIGFGILAVAVVAIFLISKAAYDRSVREEAALEQRAEAAQEQLEADRAADAAVAAQATELAETKADLDAATAEAARADPSAAAAAIGPVSQSYYDTLRRKKETR